MSLLPACEIVADLGSFEDAGPSSASAASSGGATSTGPGGGEGAATSASGGSGGEGCPGDEELCGRSCTNTTDNPLHCGRCDYVCASGACSGQACEPVELTVDGDAIERLAHDATHLYWVSRTGTTERNISRAAKPQGAPELVGPNLSVLSHFLESGPYLFFDSSTGSIRRMSKISMKRRSTRASSGSFPRTRRGTWCSSAP